MKRGRWREAVGKIDGRPVFIDINMVCPPLCQFLAAISERHVSLHGHVKANDNVRENGGRLCDNRAPHPLSRYFSYLLLRLFSHSLSLPYFFFLFYIFHFLLLCLFLPSFFLSLSLSLSFSTVGRFISASVKILRGRDCIVKKQNEGTTGCINFRKLFLPRCNVRIKGTWRLIRKCPRDRASPSFL